MVKNEVYICLISDLIQHRFHGGILQGKIKQGDLGPDEALRK